MTATLTDATQQQQAEGSVFERGTPARRKLLDEYLAGLKQGPRQKTDALVRLQHLRGLLDLPDGTVDGDMARVWRQLAAMDRIQAALDQPTDWPAAEQAYRDAKAEHDRAIAEAHEQLDKARRAAEAAYLRACVPSIQHSMANRVGAPGELSGLLWEESGLPTNSSAPAYQTPEQSFFDLTNEVEGDPPQAEGLQVTRNV